MRESVRRVKELRFKQIKSEYSEEKALRILNDRETAIKENVSFYRRRLGLTQEQLAEILGISRIHIANIESLNVSKCPSRELEYRIAVALQITPDQLEKRLGERGGKGLNIMGEMETI